MRQKIYTVVMFKRNREIARFQYTICHLAHTIAQAYLDEADARERRSVSVIVDYV